MAIVGDKPEPTKLSERLIQKKLYHRLFGNRLVLPNFTPNGWFECDIWVLTKSGYGREYEIKLTVSDFKADAKKMFSGIGDLYINGKKQDTVEMPNMHRSTYSLAETFDIGIDTGTQVSKIYQGTNKFTGTLDNVVITLTK